MGATKVDSWYGNIVVSILIQLILHRLRTTQLYPRMYGKLRNAPSVVFLNWDRIINMDEQRTKIRKLPCRHDTLEACINLCPLIQKRRCTFHKPHLLIILSESTHYNPQYTSQKQRYLHQTSSLRHSTRIDSIQCTDTSLGRLL